MGKFSLQIGKFMSSDQSNSCDIDNPNPNTNLNLNLNLNISIDINVQCSLNLENSSSMMIQQNNTYLDAQKPINMELQNMLFRLGDRLMIQQKNTYLDAQKPINIEPQIIHYDLEEQERYSNNTIPKNQPINTQCLLTTSDKSKQLHSAERKAQINPPQIPSVNTEIIPQILGNTQYKSKPRFNFGQRNYASFLSIAISKYYNSLVKVQLDLQRYGIQNNTNKRITFTKIVLNQIIQKQKQCFLNQPLSLYKVILKFFENKNSQYDEAVQNHPADEIYKKAYLKVRSSLLEQLVNKAITQIFPRDFGKQMKIQYGTQLNDQKKKKRK